MDSERLTTDKKVQRFVRLLTSNQSRIYAHIMSLTANFNDSDDIMQDTSAMMWEKFDTFTQGTDFFAWATTIAYYRVLEYRRKRKHTGQVQFSEEVFAGLHEGAGGNMEDMNEYLGALRNCVEKLPDSDRELVNMRYMQGTTVKEISVCLGRTVQSIYQNITRIHNMLLGCVRRAVSFQEKQ